MYYIEMLAIWRVSTPSGVVCLDSRAIWRVSTPMGMLTRHIYTSSMPKTRAKSFKK